MPATPRNAVRVEGLEEYRRSLRGTDRGALRMLQAVTRGAAEIVARDARTRAPRGTRPIPSRRVPGVRLADSIKATTAGHAGVVKSDLPYAKVQEYGGTIRPKGSPVVIRRREFVTRALEAKQEAVGVALERGFDAVLRRNGWR